VRLHILLLRFVNWALLSIVLLMTWVAVVRQTSSLYLRWLSQNHQLVVIFVDVHFHQYARLRLLP
jgi:hypothetical protein